LIENLRKEAFDDIVEDTLKYFDAKALDSDQNIHENIELFFKELRQKKDRQSRDLFSILISRQPLIRALLLCFEAIPKEKLLLKINSLQWIELSAQTKQLGEDSLYYFLFQDSLATILQEDLKVQSPT
jgi:hypothetical protein